jgi:hypothetical protein
MWSATKSGSAESWQTLAIRLRESAGPARR